jgi:hypothetical protein
MASQISRVRCSIENAGNSKLQYATGKPSHSRPVAMQMASSRSIHVLKLLEPPPNAILLPWCKTPSIISGGDGGGDAQRFFAESIGGSPRLSGAISRNASIASRGDRLPASSRCAISTASRFSKSSPSVSSECSTGIISILLTGGCDNDQPPSRLRGGKRPSDSVAGETPAATREDACAPRNCATATSTYGARASMVCEAKNAELPEAR